MPKHRIAPSEHLRQALHEFLQQGIEQEASPTSALLGLAARVVLQEALEGEQRDALGRQRYQRGSQGRYRNGYRPGCVESAEGRIRVEVPQCAHFPQFEQRFRSKANADFDESEQDGRSAAVLLRTK
jgi:transposase-like protein